MYKITTPRETYELDANNKDDLRKDILVRENIEIEKIKETTELDISIYYQRSSRYKNWHLGNSITSMQNYGCALMCFSFVTGKDPKDVDKLFIDNDVYRDADWIKDGYEADDDMIDFGLACKVLGLSDYKKDSNINNMPSQEMTIKEVWLGYSKHFVVRINENGSRKIFDPWTGDYQKINYYPFISYRVFNK